MARWIAVYTQDDLLPGPRLPLLGLPAFLDNDLDWWLDPQRRQLTVQSRTWRRLLIRVLCGLDTICASGILPEALGLVRSACPVYGGIVDVNRGAG